MYRIDLVAHPLTGYTRGVGPEKPELQVFAGIKRFEGAIDQEAFPIRVLFFHQRDEIRTAPAARVIDIPGKLHRDDGTGRFILDFDAKLVRTLTGLDLTKPLPALWPQFDALARVPMIVVRGENSRLLSVAIVDEMARRHAALHVVTVRGQGHAPFLETGALPQTIAAFFDEAESGNQAEGGTAA